MWLYVEVELIFNFGSIGIHVRGVTLAYPLIKLSLPLVHVRTYSWMISCEEIIIYLLNKINMYKDFDLRFCIDCIYFDLCLLSKNACESQPSHHWFFDRQFNWYHIECLLSIAHAAKTVYFGDFFSFFLILRDWEIFHKRWNEQWRLNAWKTIEPKRKIENFQKI